MKLHSDFLDYYDHHFSTSGSVFERLTRSGMNRIEIFEFLKRKGYNIPKVGLAKKLYNPINPYKKVVIYKDVEAHCGEGKIILSLIEAIKYYPDYFCSYYIEQPKPISKRLLQIGTEQYILLYESKSDKWRSNVGDVLIYLLEHRHKKHPSIDLPLFAIDFVSDDANTYAIDFNIAPKIKGTGIENILPSKKAFELIMSWYQTKNGWGDMIGKLNKQLV